MAGNVVWKNRGTLVILSGDVSLCCTVHRKYVFLVEFVKEGSWSSSRFDRRLIGGQRRERRRGERQEEMEVLSLVWLGAAWSRLI